MNNEKVTYSLAKKFVTGNWESTFISLIACNNWMYYPSILCFLVQLGVTSAFYLRDLVVERS